MKRNICSISLGLLLGIIGALAFTAPEYVDCRPSYADEFLDLVLISQGSVFLVSIPCRNSHPLFLRSFKIFYFEGGNLLCTVLRL